jgi:hypothetical protein
MPMRTLIRGALMGLVLSAAVLSACQRQAPSSDDPATAPTNAEREAEIAAETLAALGGPANADQRAPYEGEFQASGGIDTLGNAEGAWELSLLTDYAQFTRPGLGEDGGIPGERDYRERGMRVVAGPLTITISQQACTASGVELPYTAHVLFEGVAYQGCARRGVIEGERPTWASVLPELIPAIDTCLGRATSRPVRITHANALDEGEVSVRLREANGSRHECIVSGGAVSVYEPLSDVDRRGGEGDPEFQRGGNQPGARSCRTIEPAVDRTGTQLGWLIRTTC